MDTDGHNAALARSGGRQVDYVEIEQCKHLYRVSIF